MNDPREVTKTVESIVTSDGAGALSNAIHRTSNSLLQRCKDAGHFSGERSNVGRSAQK